jgi:hypothetical protein
MTKLETAFLLIPKPQLNSSEEILICQFLIEEGANEDDDIQRDSSRSPSEPFPKHPFPFQQFPAKSRTDSG